MHNDTNTHEKIYTEISPIEAIAALAHAGAIIPSGFAFKDRDGDNWMEEQLAGVAFKGYSFIDGNETHWKNCARVTLAPKIADGHNPEKLTVDQVGVNEGWRLLTKDEHDLNEVASDTQYWYASSAWSDTDEWFTRKEPLRTKQPSGFYLPKPDPSLKPWDFASAPKSLVWVRLKDNDVIALVLFWREESVGFFFGEKPLEISYASLFKEYEHSTDFGVNWKPCGIALTESP